jgi:hypothetical protein
MIRSTINNEQWYKSMLVGNAPFLPSGYELISSTILGTATSSVTFSSLGDYSSAYKHLQIRYVARSDRGTYANDSLQLILNADTTGANYKSHILYGGGTSGFQSGVGSEADLFTAQGIGDLTASVATAGNFGVGVIDILDAYGSRNKTSRSLSGFQQSNTAVASYAAVRIALISQLWINTSSLTSIALRPAFGTNLVSGSRFSLYGIKG